MVCFMCSVSVVLLQYFCTVPLLCAAVLCSGLYAAVLYSSAEFCFAVLQSSDPNKTGQYGVGFNCVYHLTDAPSFMTGGNDVEAGSEILPSSEGGYGETLCVFDPHARFVPGASRDEPGRRYADVAQLRPIFTDVFPCYLEDKFDLAHGTMFRLPLRTETMASESELSEHVVTNDLIDTLFMRFKQDMFDCLLFVNSVESISLSEVSINHSGRKLLH